MRCCTNMSVEGLILQAIPGDPKPSCRSFMIVGSSMQAFKGTRSLGVVGRRRLAWIACLLTWSGGLLSRKLWSIIFTIMNLIIALS